MISCIKAIIGVIISLTKIYTKIYKAFEHLTAALRIVSSSLPHCTNNASHLRYHSGKLHSIDPDIIEVFERFDIHASSYVEMRRPMLPPTPCEDFSSQSDMFTSLMEARRSLYRLANCYHTLEQTTERCRREDTCTLNEHARVQSLCQQLEIWRSRLSLLIKLLSASHSPTDFRAISILQIDHLLYRIKSSTCLERYETAFDKYDADFDDIVALSENMDNRATPATMCTGFTIEIGNLLPLYFTSLKCRSRPIRKRALELLATANREEGVWNSAALAKLAEHAQYIEEEGLCEASLEKFRVPDERRIYMLSCSFSPQRGRRRACLVYTLRDSTIAGGFIEKYCDISWTPKRVGL